MSDPGSKIRITEIFHSLQGESATVGWPTVFIRLTGCPLRCGYCDTEYAFQGGEHKSIEEIVSTVKQYKTDYVCVTGGEPLAQKACVELLAALCDQGKYVSLETSGALDVAGVDPRVTIVMDLKTPGSCEESKNEIENLEYLKPSDQVKFVLCNMTDYEWARNLIAQHNLSERFEVLMSPVWKELSATDLADKIIEDQLAVRMQVQLHKYLWNDEPGR